MDLAKIVTEKETLEMTLELRDKELKAKKEEFRKELVSIIKAFPREHLLSSETKSDRSVY